MSWGLYREVKNQGRAGLSQKEVRIVDGCRVKLDVEELASAIVVADPADAESIAQVKKLLAGLAEDAKHQELIEPVGEALQDALTAGKLLEQNPDAKACASVGEAVESLQKTIVACHRARAASCKFKQSQLATAGKAPAKAQSLAAVKQRDATPSLSLASSCPRARKGCRAPTRY